MSTGAVFAFTLCFLVGFQSGCSATEPITGWGQIKFGMSRENVQQTYNTDDWDQCDAPAKAAPYECKGEHLQNITLNGLRWSGVVWFLPKFGAAKIALWLEDKDQVPALYEMFKRDLAEKYGSGTATPAVGNTCDRAQRQWDAGEKVTNADWIITNEEMFIIRREGAIVSLYGRTQSLCGNTPRKVYPNIKNTLSLWRTLSVTYQTMVNVPKQF